MKEKKEALCLTCGQAISEFEKKVKTNKIKIDFFLDDHRTR